MKNKVLIKPLLLLIFLVQTIFVFSNNIFENGGEVYLFAYAPNDGKDGLNLAWSEDKVNWHEIGPKHRFLFSDYGAWGSQKRMYAPYLFQDKSGLWHCIWSLNDEVGEFAHAASKNLYEWKRQSYPEVMKNGNFKDPEVSFDASKEEYIITWLSEASNNSAEGAYRTTTTDFKNYSATEKISISERKNNRVTIKLDEKQETGVVYKVNWDLVDGLIKHEEWVQFHNSEREENLNDDVVRFKDLKPLNATITVEPTKSKAISNMLIGAFFEDINYAADGGLYAELIQNRDFEYTIADTKGRDENWNSKKAWSVSTDEVDFTIANKNPIHKNNPNYAILEVKRTGAGITNEGFDGIPVVKGDTYDFSVFAKKNDDSTQSLKVQIKTKEGRVVGETKINNIGIGWKKHKATIKIKASVESAVLEIIPMEKGSISLDMISLFPQKTFKNRKNGLRADLAETIAAIKPKFVRFPGGCVAHGDGIHNIYKWKNTIGPLEARVPQSNIWRYHQSAGLGYYEYFQFCEDINAAPLPVIAAGVPCQNSSTGGNGQQGGIPMDEMDAYVQDILDLIEWANGDKNTKWGKVRAQAGHPEPFNLKYIGIGNEDLITDVFEERFTMIFNAIKEKHPEITVIGTVGPFYMGTDYEEGWDLATKLDVPMVDEHYYQTPGWFINNQDYYDKYDRNKSKVYLGEYAAHVPNRRMNIQTSLTEALYLTSVERNGDVVSMTSFAPLLAKKGHTQWNPDLIYFNNTEVFPTVDYYVQVMYGNNVGETYIPSNVKLSNDDENVKKRVGVSIVKDKESQDIILKLVNALPVAINSAIDLKELGVKENSKAALTVLKGVPNDENQKPITTNISITSNLDYQLPAYSFSVIRIKSE